MKYPMMKAARFALDRLARSMESVARKLRALNATLHRGNDDAEHLESASDLGSLSADYIPTWEQAAPADYESNGIGLGY